MNERTVTAESLHRFYAACLQAMGVPDKHSRICADGLSYADMHGIVTHGASSFNRLYLKMLREGGVNPAARPLVQRSHRAVAVVDGCNGLGFISALAENLWMLIKTECVRGRVFATHAEANLALFEYIDGFYNSRRIQERLGYLSPIEFEEKHYTEQVTTKQANLNTRQPALTS